MANSGDSYAATGLLRLIKQRGCLKSLTFKSRTETCCIGEAKAGKCGSFVANSPIEI
jgi:hypothetical protein